jgi:hypothetical protein
MEELLNELVRRIASHGTVRAMGLSGGERPLPGPGEGDIDLFVYCTEIPGVVEREEWLAPPGMTEVQVGRLSDGHWGQGDSLVLAGVETWLLYFTVSEAREELEAVLRGEYLERLDNYYYPTGRLAMWKTMRALYDPDGLLASFRQRVQDYPASLARALSAHHMRALADVEDLERAVVRRDPLFYHFALDLALDHFLQALFALNREYFPSRKRSAQYIERFQVKPPECIGRLERVLASGGEGETLEESYRLWRGLVEDLEELAGEHGPASRRPGEPS